MGRRYETDEWVSKTLTIEGICIEARVHVVGWYSCGDSWGYGCEPPDGETKIVDIEIEEAHKEGTDCVVEVTRNLIKKLREELESDSCCLL